MKIVQKNKALIDNRMPRFMQFFNSKAVDLNGYNQWVVDLSTQDVQDKGGISVKSVINSQTAWNNYWKKLECAPIFDKLPAGHVVLVDFIGLDSELVESKIRLSGLFSGHANYEAVKQEKDPKAKVSPQAVVRLVFTLVPSNRFASFGSCVVTYPDEGEYRKMRIMRAEQDFTL